MRIPRFYTSSALSIGSTCRLEDSTAHYAANVLRLQAGATVTLFNGRGGEYQALIRSLGRKQVEVEITQFDPIERESPLHTQLAIGLSRGDRMDWVVQKATELGVSAIVPLLTERTEVKLNKERLEKKLQHWQQVSISACEQSQRTRLPQISVPRQLQEVCRNCEAEKKLVFHGDGQSAGLGSDSTVSSVALLIGPEGGLSDAELSVARDCGFASHSLGPRILRTETAPIAALTLVQNRWGDL